MPIFAAVLTGILWSGPARAEPVSFNAPLTGAECKPAVETAGTGIAALSYDPAARLLNWQVTFGGLSSSVTQAHIHAPGAEPGKGVVLIWLSKPGTPPESPIVGQAVLTPEQVAQFAAGQWWINVHTRSNPACEIRGQVTPPKA
jgi:CHRD domain